jgi:hypothetical protein
MVTEYRNCYKTRLPSYIIEMSFKPKRNTGGRPRKQNSLHATIKVSDELKIILDGHRRYREERYNDIILRLYKERTMFKQENEQLRPPPAAA